MLRSFYRTLERNPTNLQSNAPILEKYSRYNLIICHGAEHICQNNSREYSY